MNDVAIIGIGATRWGKYPDKANEDLAREAILAALKDANLAWTDIQCMITGIDPYAGSTQGNLAGNTIAANLGYTGIRTTSLFNACATGSFALDVGRAFILSGLADIVLCVGAFKSPGGFFGVPGANLDDPHNLDAMRFKLLGRTNPSSFAYLAMRRMHNFGMTEHDIAMIKVKNSKHGKFNPLARYQNEFTIEEVMASPMVSYPLRLFELAATSDGAAAVIICNLKKAKQYTTKFVRLAASHAPQPIYPYTDLGIFPLATHSEISTQRTPPGVERTHQYQVIRGAFEQAGLGSEDVDFAEVYDLSTPMELDWMEDIGLCKYGEAEKLLREGATTIGGRIPINTSGGVAAFGEAASPQGLLQIYELVTQLRGDAGPRQLKNPKVGLATSLGGGSNVCCMIVKK